MNKARPRWWRELLLVAAVFTVYGLVTSLDWPSRHGAALDNGRAILQAEQSVGLDIELSLNRWLNQHEIIRVIANYEYAYTYVITSFGLLIWLYIRRPETYRWARNSFVLINLLGVSVFAVYPVAPPRLDSDLGFTDTVVDGRTFGSWGTPFLSHANQLGAMPSLHIAWALWVGLVVATFVGRWVGWLAGSVHLLVTLFVIMATANHYWLDAVGGALLAVGSVALARPRLALQAEPDGLAAPEVLFLEAGPATSPPDGGWEALDRDTTAIGRESDFRRVFDALMRARVNEETDGRPSGGGPG
jgi:PAP2 superfamily protein